MLQIKPTKLEIGCGYIETDNKFLSLDEIYKVQRFREKLNEEVAEEYLNLGKFYGTIRGF